MMVKQYRNFTGASLMIYTLELMAVQQTLENILLCVPTRI